MPNFKLISLWPRVFSNFLFRWAWTLLTDSPDQAATSFVVSLTMAVNLARTLNVFGTFVNTPTSATALLTPGCQALPCSVDWLQAGLFFPSGIFREPPLPGLVVYGWQGQYQHLPQSAREQWLANSPAPAGNQSYLTRKHKFIQLFPVHGFYLWRLVFRFP